MRKLYNNQDGRSMVEMLGVLAIIGVLSIGGISGYSRAMTKFKVSKTMDQVAMTVANIRTMYAGQKDYKDLNTKVAANLGVLPSEMVFGEKILNSFQGDVFVSTATCSQADDCFSLTYDKLPKEVCSTVATADWGSGSSSGLRGMLVQASLAGAEVVGLGDAIENPNLPMTPAEASEACEHLSDNSVTWFYF